MSRKFHWVYKRGHWCRFDNVSHYKNYVMLVNRPGDNPPPNAPMIFRVGDIDKFVLKGRQMYRNYLKSK